MHNNFMRGELLQLSTIGRVNRMQRHVAGKALDTLNKFVEVSNA